MALSIRSETGAVVARPSQPCSWELLVLKPDGSPAPGEVVRVTVAPRGAAAVEPPAPADEAGVVRLSLRAGPSPARATVQAVAGKAKWQGELFVTPAPVHLPSGISLTPPEETLLRMLFWDRERLQVLEQFGGYSNSRVLKVQAFDRHSGRVPQIVKIGARDRIRQEWANYQRFFQGRLPSATHIREHAELGAAGAVIYEDAHESGRLERVRPLADYFARSSSEDVTAALYAILEKGMRRVYRYYSVRPLALRDLFGRSLFESLVVTLGGGQPPCGVYPPGRSPPDAPRPGPPHPGRPPLTEGELLALDRQVIARVEGDYLLVQDPHSRDSVRVRYDGASPPRVSAGDEVDVVGRFVTDYERRLPFAVRHCLEGQGGTVAEGQVRFGPEVYPHPLALLGGVLEQNADLAWAPIHGDLHWQNVMLEGPTNWWLIDYQLAREGPVLLDFIRLELFLRFGVLSAVPNLDAAQLLAFEQDLADNPLGRLPPRRWECAELDRAADAIRAIRRMARRYVLEDFFDYWRLLFVAAVGLAKFYPTPDRWAAPDAPRAHEKVSWEVFTALAPALVVGRALQWEAARAGRPPLRCRFVPMGSVLAPEPGAVALDVGNRCEPGVIDHHGGGGGCDCTATLVHQRPELLETHLAGVPPEEVTWTVHEGPDFDCVASAYLAWHRLSLGYFPPGSAALAAYTLEVDRGAAFLDVAPFPERTPCGLVTLSLLGVESAGGGLAETYRRRMQVGFEIMDYLCRLEALGTHTLADNLVPNEHDFLKAPRRDREQFDHFDLPLAQPFTATLRRDGHLREVRGLALQAPRAHLFRTWARRAGFPLLLVRWPQADKPDHRLVISVPVAYTNALKGLGKALEQAEEVKRERLGKRRPGPPRFPDVGNDDPWYDGRSPAHAYTIVDAPRQGTVLDLEEVLAILRGGGWIEPEAGS